MQYLAILGQNAQLSLAELLAVYPKIQIIISDKDAVVFESKIKLDIARLGGMPKFAEILDIGNPEKIIFDYLCKLPKEKKIFFGLSFYGKPDKKLGITLKKKLKNAGYKVRLVTSRDLALSSVVIKTNKLLRRGGDFCIFKNYVARTVAVQDFSDYEFRDVRRPARDLVSGMTPPKLAKMLINLGGASDAILDPFCGSGTFLMEAVLLGFHKVYGSDINDKAVKDSMKNLDWLKEQYKFKSKIEIKKCDIKTAGACWDKKFEYIATEPYLGPPIRGTLDLEKAKNLQKELEKNYDEYLKGLSKLLTENGTIILIVPYIITAEKKLYLNLDIKKYGLKPVYEPILYSRPNQKIGREIYILEKS
ncbi:TRM11 family SAM-dependent methyltransferase [Patescibacteria group bacterium]